MRSCRMTLSVHTTVDVQLVNVRYATHDEGSSQEASGGICAPSCLVNADSYSDQNGNTRSRANRMIPLALVHLFLIPHILLRWT